jgi:hypothetical protein
MPCISFAHLRSVEYVQTPLREALDARNSISETPDLLAGSRRALLSLSEIGRSHSRAATCDHGQRVNIMVLMPALLCVLQHPARKRWNAGD